MAIRQKRGRDLRGPPAPDALDVVPVFPLIRFYLRPEGAEDALPDELEDSVVVFFVAVLELVVWAAGEELFAQFFSAWDALVSNLQSLVAVFFRDRLSLFTDIFQRVARFRVVVNDGLHLEAHGRKVTTFVFVYRMCKYRFCCS